MIFESISGRYEKTFFLVFETKIHKVKDTTFQVNFIVIKHSLKRFIKIFENSVINFSCTLGLIYLLY